LPLLKFQPSYTDPNCLTMRNSNGERPDATKCAEFLYSFHVFQRRKQWQEFWKW